MPIPKIPKVVCILCGKEVSRRSTLSLEALASTHGRACRAHREVAALVQEFAENKLAARTLKQVERRLQIISAAAGLRVLCSLHGLSPEFAYSRIRANFPNDTGLVSEIEKEVARCGGLIMSTQEISEMVMSMVWLSQKRKELGLPPGMP